MKVLRVWKVRKYFVRSAKVKRVVKGILNQSSIVTKPKS